MQNKPAPPLGDWALLPLWPEQLEELISAVRLALLNTYDLRTHQTQEDLLEYLSAHQSGSGAEQHPEAGEIERIWRDLWLPAFDGKPGLARIKKELFEYAMLLRAIAEEYSEEAMEIEDLKPAPERLVDFCAELTALSRKYQLAIEGGVQYEMEADDSERRYYVRPSGELEFV